jgi:SAM-dependent methyltransferase
MSDRRWVETPMFMMRRDCVAMTTAGWKVGRFLEVGAGTGHLTRSFLERGFTGTCYDLGAESRAILRENLSSFAGMVDVVDSLADVEVGSFDYVFAFEVLEHIQADGEALRSWLRFLKPGGHALISVPAHMRKYSEEDRAVGHCRRYEREQLERLFKDMDCAELRVLSYGFPLAILTRRGNQLLSRRKGNGWTEVAETAEARSIRSGIERSAASVRLSKILNHRTLAPFIAFQRLFFRTDLGDGYVACATKRRDTDEMPASGSEQKLPT